MLHQERIEEIIHSYITNNQFMGSILIAKKGYVLLDKGYGFANLEWRIPNTSTTKFRLGSLTKQFTAAAVLLPDVQIEFFKNKQGKITRLMLQQDGDRFTGIIT